MTAVGNEAQIAEALFLRLDALPLSPALPVSYPNRVFPESGTGKPDTYLDVTLLRGQTQAVGIASWDENVGILQVDVVYKKQDGELKPLQIADSVASWFKRGTRLFNGNVQVDIYDPPQVGAMVPDDAYRRIPVSIRYRCFTP